MQDEYKTYSVEIYLSRWKTLPSRLSFVSTTGEKIARDIKWVYLNGEFELRLEPECVVITPSEAEMLRVSFGDDYVMIEEEY